MMSQRKNEKMVSDITHMWTGEGLLYIASAHMGLILKWIQNGRKE